MYIPSKKMVYWSVHLKRALLHLLANDNVRLFLQRGEGSKTLVLFSVDASVCFIAFYVSVHITQTKLKVEKTLDDNTDNKVFCQMRSVSKCMN